MNRFAASFALFLLCFGGSGPPTRAIAQEHDESPGVTIVVPPQVAPEEHFEIRVEVLLRDGQRGPLLVTPRAEGAVFEVVRGRLLTIDALDPRASPLVFMVPAVARAQGSGRFVVSVDGFRCASAGREECTAFREEAEAAVTVSGGPTR